MMVARGSLSARHYWIMRWQRALTAASLVLIWVAFAAWQYRLYVHERNLINETLHQQAHTVMRAVIGGMQSHRRMGRFFHGQLQGTLDGLVKSDDILAVAVTSDTGESMLSAGSVDLLDLSPTMTPGDRWYPAGFRLVELCRLSPAADGEHETGQMAGPGLGRGWRRQLGAENSDGPLAAGGEFMVALLLSRSRSDTLCQRAAWSYSVVAVAGALLLACLALAWRSSVRLVAAKGRAELLENEAKHLT